jgi:hypothetical protein
MNINIQQDKLWSKAEVEEEMTLWDLKQKARDKKAENNKDGADSVKVKVVNKFEREAMGEGYALLLDENLTNKTMIEHRMISEKNLEGYWTVKNGELNKRQLRGLLM